MFRLCFAIPEDTQALPPPQLFLLPPLASQVYLRLRLPFPVGRDNPATGQVVPVQRHVPGQWHRPRRFVSFVPCQIRQSRPVAAVISWRAGLPLGGVEAWRPVGCRGACPADASWSLGKTAKGAVVLLRFYFVIG